MRRPRAVLFDLDGTLTDSAPAIARALAVVWRAAGRSPPPLDAVRDMIGDGPGVLIEKSRQFSGLKEDADAAAAEVDAFMQAYSADGPGGDAYPDALATLRSLAAGGTAMAVCTNKPQAAAERLLAALGFAPFLAGVVGGDATPRRKPDPAHVQRALALLAEIAPEDAVLVGDGLQDVAAAEAAGVPVIVARYGYGGAHAARPDLPAIDAIGELPAFLERAADA